MPHADPDVCSLVAAAAPLALAGALSIGCARWLWADEPWPRRRHGDEAPGPLEDRHRCEPPGTGACTTAGGHGASP